MNNQTVDFTQERWCSACDKTHPLYYLEDGKVQTTFAKSRRSGWQSWCKVKANAYNINRQRERRRELREQAIQQEATRSMSHMATAIQQYDLLRRITEHAQKSLFITLEELYDIFDRYHFQCAVCGDRHINVAHIVTLRCNGESRPENVIPLCNTCKISKLDRNMEEWLTSVWQMNIGAVLTR